MVILRCVWGMIPRCENQHGLYARGQSRPAGCTQSIGLALPVGKHALPRCSITGIPCHFALPNGGGHPAWPRWLPSFTSPPLARGRDVRGSRIMPHTSPPSPINARQTAGYASPRRVRDSFTLGRQAVILQKRLGTAIDARCAVGAGSASTTAWHSDGVSASHVSPGR